MAVLAHRLGGMTLTENFKPFVTILTRRTDTGIVKLIQDFDTQEEAETFGTNELPNYGEYVVYNFAAGKKLATYQWKMDILDFTEIGRTPHNRKVKIGV